MSCMENMVSYDDFEELARTVRELQSTIQSMEMESNDMMTSWSDMATCVSDIAEKMNPQPETTEMPETSRERSTTIETSTTMPETSTTMPETSRARPTTNEPTVMPTRTMTTSEPTVMPTRTMTTSDPSMPPTRTATTKEPTMPPTFQWEMYADMRDEGENNKCTTASSQRSFRLVYTTVDNCVKRCYDDASCMYAVTDENKWCIGCKQVTQAVADWDAYVIRGREPARRQLSEIEQLRAENAALRAELLKLRRN